jgi:rhamnose utilization protein RhaD (predicted bifunctional aldolase and dehydrogenase)
MIDINSFCKKVGSSFNLAQGPGGNISYKEKGVLWIKASGKWLENANKENIFVPVKQEGLIESLKRGDYVTKKEIIKKTLPKASIEISLHAILPFKYVIHLHIISILKFLVRKNYIKEIEKITNKEFNASYIDYVKPGPDLAWKMEKEIINAGQKKIYFLQNHGVVICSDSLLEIDKIINKLEITFKPYFHELEYNFNKKINSPNSDYSFIYPEKYNYLAYNLFNKIFDSWALYPDHLVFLGTSPNIFDSVKEAKIEMMNNACEYLIVKDYGVLVKKNISLSSIMHLKIYTEIINNQLKSRDLSLLNVKQVSELVNWDAELYRKNVMI